MKKAETVPLALTSVGAFNEVDECLEDDDIRARVVRLEKKSPRKVWRIGEGRARRLRRGEFEKRGSFDFCNTFFHRGKNGRRLVRFGTQALRIR